MNFKKSTCLFLAFLLLVFNIGFAFNVHYCGGKVASVSLETVSPIAEKGCCAKSEKKLSCCKDKIVKLEKKSDNATFKVFFFQLAFPAVVQEFNPVAILAISNFKNSQIISYFSDANAPPLFQLYQKYIFYA